MAVFNYNDYEIHYEFRGDPGTPVVTFINGLTQRTDHWTQYTDVLNKAGYRVLSYDLLGQGTSSKPVLFVDFDENPKILAGLLDHLHVEQAYLGGVSFGGIIVLRFGIGYPERVKGLIPMSCFTEMDAQLYKIGTNLYSGMVNVGVEYLVSLLIPINFSSRWMAENQESIPLLERNAASYNDLYGIQNLMESIRDFKPFTHELCKISCPTLILNGEYDCLTPRCAHELLRVHISNSRLMLMQHVCHAFTIEIPQITCRVIADFVDQVESGKWVGDKSVWVAADDPNADVIAFPCQGDHTRNIPFVKNYRAGVNMPNNAGDIKAIATDYFASHALGAEEQTRISLFLTTLKQANAMILAKNEFQPMDWRPYALLHRQYYKEIEMSTMLQKITHWSMNPFLYAEAAQANLAFWSRLNVGQYLMNYFSQDQYFFEYLAVSHAFMSEVRFIPLFPPDQSLDDPFYAALYAIENENGRQIQTQIRFLKEMELPLTREEKEQIVNRKRQIVGDLFCDLLEAVCQDRPRTAGWMNPLGGWRPLGRAHP